MNSTEIEVKSTTFVSVISTLFFMIQESCALDNCNVANYPDFGRDKSLIGA